MGVANYREELFLPLIQNARELERKLEAGSRRFPLPRGGSAMTAMNPNWEL
jgi:hypothetical protein